MTTPVRFLTAAALVCLGAPSLATPAEQADCPYDRMTEQQRAVAGQVLFVQMNGEKSLPFLPSEVEEAQTALEKAMAQCAETHKWTEDEASAAFSYSTTRMLSEITRRYVEHLGGDAAAADLFFAQNKYTILDEDAAGNSSKEWANTRLLELGFAKKGSRAFEVVWLYYGLLFQADDERVAFVSGKKPEKTKAPAE